MPLTVRQLTPQVGRLWRAWVALVRQSLDPQVLQDALRAPHRLDAEQVVMGQWSRLVEGPARQRLPQLFLDIYAQVVGDLASARTALAGGAVSPQLPVATREALASAAQQQITALTQTTLLGLRALLRSGQTMPLAAQVAQIQQGFGLTMAQLQALAAAQDRWQTEGRAAAQIATATEAAVQRGLAARLATIAQTQAALALNLSHRLALTQAAQTSPVGTAGVRRYWMLGPRPCAVCQQIPRLHPEGVALDAPFVSSTGLRMDPPLHPNCLCTIAVR